ncbi:peptidylprolyl isomerase [Flavobacterium soyangense]|uniref:peptidylprolyl isomerase n=1 Tax=Flavobacterium soyangense TaxID=2023265 RepID=A0A930UBF6_9FLAO|nr:peptidylprolyl isomerase [Flavobacterium soyangense]MBF2707772.1 peptidylprolyl isomerase [Flavobacterium soyangense]
MKKLILFIIIFISFQSFSQTIKEQLKQIITIDDAKKLATENPNLEAELLNIHPEIETDDFATKLADAKTGEIFSDLDFTYKILFETNINAFRVSYIFLDASKISLAEIEKLRTEILEEYKNGISFSNLANKYTMDNGKDGDLGWFAEGMMVPDFEKAVKNHKQNDIFKVDIENEKWYYIVLKTFNDKPIREFTVLKIKSNT